MKHIGLIGAGRMGVGIAANIVRRGYALGVLDHPGNQPLEDLVAAGMQLLPSAAAVAARSEVVILVLTGSPDVEAVLTGDGGVLQALRPGSIVIDCTTAIPSSTLRMAQAVERAGSRFLDAPMTRTPVEAAQGRLNLLVGGDAAVLERCRALLACFAENITHVGPVASGHRMKLLHNGVSLGMVALLSEAAASARASGVSMDAFVEVLAKGGGGGVALERLKPYLLAGDASGLRFSVANAHKDLSYYARMAEEAGAAARIAGAVGGTFAAVEQSGGAQALVSELVDWLAPPRAS